MAEKLAIVVGGGPAPGINGVVSAVTFEAIKHGLHVVGIYDGFKWLSKGDTSHVMALKNDEISRIHLRESSIIRTSRDNPTKSPEKMANVIKALTSLGIRYLVTIGGDDTALRRPAWRRRRAEKLQFAMCPRPSTTICRFRTAFPPSGSRPRASSVRSSWRTLWRTRAPRADGTS